MERPIVDYKGYPLYSAGSNFPCIFFRDQAITSELLHDQAMLKAILLFGADQQGIKTDDFTGEEPGKIFHEINLLTNQGIVMEHRPNKSTKYNASDTTAFFLRGHRKYQKWTGDESLARLQSPNIASAAAYIQSHLDSNNRFFEDPSFSGSDSFALKVTIWRDSELLGRENGEPVYPIVYTLAHFQNTAGLKSAAELLGSAELRNEVVKMKIGSSSLYSPELGSYILAIDKKGAIPAISTDSLHCLAYTDPEDIERNKIMSVIETAKTIETPIGYVAMDPQYTDNMEDLYHVIWVWPHDNANIHRGARRLESSAHLNNDNQLLDYARHIKEVSSRISIPLQTSQAELFRIVDGQVISGGSNIQLWSRGAKIYFLRQQVLDQAVA